MLFRSTVKELLGHANIAITANIYTHTRLPHQAEALSKLDSQLKSPVQKKTRRVEPGAKRPDVESTNDKE